jgi:hypothetical protein
MRFQRSTKSCSDSEVDSSSTISLQVLKTKIRGEFGDLLLDVANVLIQFKLIEQLDVVHCLLAQLISLLIFNHLTHAHRYVLICLARIMRVDNFHNLSVADRFALLGQLGSLHDLLKFNNEYLSSHQREIDEAAIQKRLFLHVQIQWGHLSLTIVFIQHNTLGLFHRVFALLRKSLLNILQLILKLFTVLLLKLKFPSKEMIVSVQGRLGLRSDNRRRCIQDASSI